MNIDDFKIDESIIDNTDGSEYRITNKTTNSIEVFIKKKIENGIDCTNWFEMSKFIKRFRKI